MSDKEISDKVESIKASSEITSNENYYITKLIESALSYNTAFFHELYSKGVDEFGFVDFYKLVLLPTFSKIGIFWLTNRIAPSQEHFFSELIKQKISFAVDQFSNNSPTKSSWLLFLPENEFHDIGLHFAKFLLCFHGHDVIFLGSNVPYASLIQFKQKKNVDNVLFFSISNQSKSNIDFTLDYLNKTFDSSNIHLVCNDMDAENLSNQSSVNILTNLDDFVSIIK
jgi:methanogenic corrinoid protein MtbC1